MNASTGVSSSGSFRRTSETKSVAVISPEVSVVVDDEDRTHPVSSIRFAASGGGPRVDRDELSRHQPLDGNVCHEL